LKKIEDGKGIIVRFVIGRRFKFLLLDLYELGCVRVIGIWNVGFMLHILFAVKIVETIWIRTLLVRIG